MMPLDIESIENLVLETPANAAAIIPEALYETPNPDPDPNPDPVALLPTETFMGKDGFLDSWYLVHDFAGGMIEMRTGQPCPIGEAARQEGGVLAGEAAFALISKSPALSKLILSSQSTFWTQVAVIGAHGFTCVQMVKASVQGPPPKAANDSAEPVFKSQRTGAKDV